MHSKVNKNKIIWLVVLFSTAKVYPVKSDENNLIDNLSTFYEQYSKILTKDLKQPCCIFSSKKRNPQAEKLKEEHRIAYLSELDKNQEIPGEFYIPDEFYVPDERYVVLESFSNTEIKKIDEKLKELNSMLFEAGRLKDIERFDRIDFELHTYDNKMGAEGIFYGSVKAQNPRQIIIDLLDAILILESAKVMDQKDFKKNEEQIYESVIGVKERSCEYLNFCSQFRLAQFKDSMFFKRNPGWNRGKKLSF